MWKQTETIRNEPPNEAAATFPAPRVGRRSRFEKPLVAHGTSQAVPPQTQEGSATASATAYRRVGQRKRRWEPVAVGLVHRDGGDKAPPSIRKSGGRRFVAAVAIFACDLTEAQTSLQRLPRASVILAHCFTQCRAIHPAPTFVTRPHPSGAGQGAWAGARYWARWRS